MRFTITRKNTNDKYVVSSVNDSEKSTKTSKIRISDAEIYKRKIIRFLDAISENELSPEELKTRKLSEKNNTVANAFALHKDEFKEAADFQELKDLVLWVLNQPSIKNQPNAAKHRLTIENMVDKYGENPRGRYAMVAYTELMKYIWNTMLKADGLESPDSERNRRSHGVTYDSVTCDADEDEESLSKEDIKALKSLVKSVPELLDLLKKSSDKKDKTDKEDKDEKESVLLETSETEESEEEPENDDEIVEDEDITEDLDESTMHDSAVMIENKNSVDDDLSKEEEICAYFNNYYASQLKK